MTWQLTVVLAAAGLAAGVLIGRWIRGWVARWCTTCGGPMACADCRRRERGEPLGWNTSTSALTAIQRHLSREEGQR